MGTIVAMSAALGSWFFLSIAWKNCSSEGYTQLASVEGSTGRAEDAEPVDASGGGGVGIFRNSRGMVETTRSVDSRGGAGAFAEGVDGPA